MTQRFQKRDFILNTFMAIILVSIWLAMFQIDRQWAFIAQTQDKIDEQTRDIADLRRQLRQGVTAAPAAAQNGELPDTWRGFARAEAISQTPDFAPGDWLVQFSGEPIYGPLDFQKLLYLAGIGATIDCEFYRPGSGPYEARIVVEERPPHAITR